MYHTQTLEPRQLWGQVSTASQIAATALCTPFTLPSGGLLVFNSSYTQTLSVGVTYKQPCEGNLVVSTDGYDNTTVIGFQEPFVASILPQVFVLACATVVAYMLVVLIMITPRTFFIGGPGGGRRLLLGRSMLPGSNINSSVLSVGRRPLLQKIATITVAASLTIATAYTFNVARNQYEKGYTDSYVLVNAVVGSLEIKIITLISDTFLWLAQVQTLIRLFPRHREKVAIKWLGFAMVTLDTVFAALNSFLNSDTETRPRRFQDAIPALAYLFELAISLIYASCVIYYSLSKRRFAFWHSRMRNICLVALLALSAVLIPVVFFVLDIAEQNVAGWGQYVRWVGAAAASVVVWEWVERIEALERDERKDGILGREIFDGDEMLDMTPSEGSGRGSRRHYFGHANGEADEENEPTVKLFDFSFFFKPLLARMPRRKRPTVSEKGPRDDAVAARTVQHVPGVCNPQSRQIEGTAAAIAPISRTDTTSPESTDYTVRYHNISTPSPANAEAQDPQDPQRPTQPAAEQSTMPPTSILAASGQSTSEDEDSLARQKTEAELEADVPRRTESRLELRLLSTLRHVANPFKRRRTTPPVEIANAQAISGPQRIVTPKSTSLMGRLSTLVPFGRDHSDQDNGVLSLPVMVIPVPAAGRTWSPGEVLNGPAVVQTSGQNTDDSAPLETTFASNNTPGPSNPVNTDQNYSGDHQHSASISNIRHGNDPRHSTNEAIERTGR